MDHLLPSVVSEHVDTDRLRTHLLHLSLNRLEARLDAQTRDLKESNARLRSVEHDRCKLVVRVQAHERVARAHPHGTAAYRHPGGLRGERDRGHQLVATGVHARDRLVSAAGHPDPALTHRDDQRPAANLRTTNRRKAADPVAPVVIEGSGG